MSKFVKVKTELRELALIKRSLDDLALKYSEDAEYTHIWSGYRRQTPLVVREQGVVYGFQLNPDGVYEVLADDMQLGHIQKSLQAIRQRYAYHQVLATTEQAGFSLIEERVGKDQVIRLTVRKWS
jgi:Protein of unknown function (DUF1257)